MNVCPYDSGAKLLVWLRLLHCFSKSPLRVQHLEGFCSECLQSLDSQLSQTAFWEIKCHDKNRTEEVEDTQHKMYGMSAMMARMVHGYVGARNDSVPPEPLLYFFLVCLARPEVKGGLAHRHGIPPRVVPCRMFQTCRNG